MRLINIPTAKQFIVVLVLFLLCLPAYLGYQLLSLANAVGDLATIVLEQERRHIIERAEREIDINTLKVRVDALTDENRWVREQK